MTRLGIIWNPTAQRAPVAVGRLLERARERGFEVVTNLETTADDPGIGQARRAVEEGCELVVACGGDGTVREVAGVLRGTGVALSVVPLGTANILSRNLGLRPSDLAGCVDAALAPGRRRIDVGLAAVQRAGEWEPETCFLVMAGLGGDAETISLVDRRVKARLGWPAYFGAGIRTLRRPAFGTTLETEDGARSTRSWCLLVGNGPSVPPGIDLFPAARLDDGRLHLLDVTVQRPWHWLGIGVAGLVRRRAAGRRLMHDEAGELLLRPDEPQLLQLDGDVVGRVEAVRLSVAPASLVVTRAAGHQAPEGSPGRP